MIRFDRAAPGEGMLLYSRIENGKAYLEFQFFMKASSGNEVGAREEPQFSVADYYVDIRVMDRDGRLVLKMNYPLQEENPARGMLLHPHLWRGTSDAYLYWVSARLMKWGAKDGLDSLERQLPLRTLEWIDKKGWFLNGEAFSFRPVVYAPPIGVENDMERQEQMQRELEQLRQLGANALCLSGTELDEDFIRICDERGLLIWCMTKQETAVNARAMDVSGVIPKFLGTTDNLFEGQEATPTDLYYYYKACWSSEPFVHMVGNSLTRKENGSASLTIYSNQKKVALYVEGVLFEFQSGPPEFRFEELPAGRSPLQLTAEAGECSVSLTVYLEAF